VRIVKVSGTGQRSALAEWVQAGIEDAWLFSLERGDPDEEPATGEQIEQWLESSGMFEADDVVVLETNETFEGLRTLLKVYILDRPFDSLEGPEMEAGRGADLVLVEWGEPFLGTGDLGLEGELKDRTGASKVLSYRTPEERERAFGKARDTALSLLGGENMTEEIPTEVVEAVKDAAEDGRVSCEQAHQIASRLGVPLETVGRALDLLRIKITRCQLGCF
jgi:hypothetical protein